MKFFQAIIDFFANLFGGRKKGEDVIDGGGETETGFWEDGADLPPDTVVTPVNESEIEAILAAEAAEESETDSETGTGSESTAGGSGIGDGGVATVDETVIVEPVEEVTTPARTPRYLWCLDNGHGQGTPGKRSPMFPNGAQFFEYEFTRDINMRIMKGLDDLGIQYFNVVPEVEGDIKLSTRTSRANSKQSALPKIYLSIHANANGNGRDWDAANGLETWYHKTSSKGIKLASAFQRHLMNTLGWRERGIRYHNDPNRAFYVLRKTAMAAVLTENGFYTHREETEKLMNPEIRQKIAQAHIDAIVEIEDKGIMGIQNYHKINRVG